MSSSTCLLCGDTIRHGTGEMDRDHGPGRCNGKSVGKARKAKPPTYQTIGEAVVKQRVLSLQKAAQLHAVADDWTAKANALTQPTSELRTYYRDKAAEARRAARELREAK
jgi:hypothetical protein